MRLARYLYVSALSRLRHDKTHIHTATLSTFTKKQFRLQNGLSGIFATSSFFAAKNITRQKRRREVPFWEDCDMPKNKSANHSRYLQRSFREKNICWKAFNLDFEANLISECQKILLTAARLVQSVTRKAKEAGILLLKYLMYYTVRVWNIAYFIR